MPGLSSRVTYVRTFSSAKPEANGSGSKPRARSPVMTNGATPSQPLPECCSSSRPSGTSRLSRSSGTR